MNTKRMFLFVILMIIIHAMISSCKDTTSNCRECWVVVNEGHPQIQTISHLGVMCGDDADYIETYTTGIKNNGYPDNGYCEQ